MILKRSANQSKEGSSGVKLSGQLATNWCVLTGGPRSGKSTVLEQLAKRGFRVVPEVARSYIYEQISCGRQLEAIVANQLEFQRAILRRMIRIEQDLDRKQRVFFDRAIPDGIGYFRKAGLDPSEVFEICRTHRYCRVFFFDRIPMELVEGDTIRRESEEEVTALEVEIERGYLEAGYHITHVPLMPVEDRVEFVLELAECQDGVLS